MCLKLKSLVFVEWISFLSLAWHEWEIWWIKFVIFLFFRKQLRLVHADGTVQYHNGDRTSTPAPKTRCNCGYKHYWDGKEYDNHPAVWVSMSMLDFIHTSVVTSHKSKFISVCVLHMSFLCRSLFMGYDSISLRWFGHQRIPR